MVALLLLLLLCLIFGIGAVIKGVLWLAFIGLLLAVILAAIAIGQVRKRARS